MSWGKRRVRKSFDSPKQEALSVLSGVHADLFSWSPPRNMQVIEYADPPRFRGSDLPVCGLKYALDTERDKPRRKPLTFQADFYLGTGHVIHELLQKWFGIAGLMYGRWQCPICKKIYPKKDDPRAGLLGPVSCKHVFESHGQEVSVPCSYIEFNPMGLKRTGKFKGNCDGVIFVAGKYAVIEIKTTSSKSIGFRRKNGPDPHHQHQVQAYRTVLPPFLGMEAEFHDFVFIMYYDRGVMSNNAVFCLDHDPDMFRNDVRDWIRAKKATAEKQWSRIKPLCTKPNQEMFCPYNAICGACDRDERIDAILPGWLDYVMRD